MKRPQRVDPSATLHRPRLPVPRRTLHVVLASFMIASALLSVGAIGKSSVKAATPEGWAYLFANQPLPNSNPYTPIWSYQFNSTGEKNTVSRIGVGQYLVQLPKLGVRAGSVHVTAVGNPIAGEEAGGPGICNVVKWGPTSGDQYVWVYCFDLSGRATDGAFTLTYANITTSPKPMAYLRTEDSTPSPTTYTPPLAYQFNSTGARNTVTWNGQGEYTAHLPGLASNSGYVQLTAFGDGNGHCQVTGWGRNETAQDVNVRCFNSRGDQAPMNFTLTYVLSTSVVGSPYKSDTSGTSSAYVLGSEPTSASYSPRREYQYNSAGETNTIKRSSTGVYQITFPQQQLKRGTLQLSVFGRNHVHCKVASWSPSIGVQVRCFTRSGAPRDAAFQATFLNTTGLRQKIADPSYFNEQNLWEDLRDGAPTVGLAIINPNSGPGTSVDPFYAQQIDPTKDEGIIVLGYVFTDRGDIPESKVKADIDKFYELYPEIDGIFFDDVYNADCDLRDQHKRLYDYVKRKPGPGTVVINPGNRTDECYISTADIIINFESYWIAPNNSDASYAPGQPQSWNLPASAWEWNYPPERFWHLVHGTPEDDMSTAIRLSKQRNAGWVYVTDDVMNNPWNSLPTYWDAELTRAAAH